MFSITQTLQLMAVPQCGPNDIQLNLTSDEWEDYVNAFKKELDQEPNPAGPPTAIFQLESGKQLCVTQLDTVSLDSSTLYSEVAESSFVDTIYKLLPKDNRGKKPYNIDVIAVVDGQEKQYSIRLAGTKFKEKDLDTERPGGVIHNVPRTKP